MQVEPEIAFRNVDPTPAMEEQILRALERLERIHPRIIACRIMVEIPHPRHVKGNLYRVRLDITVPGHEIVVSRDPPARHTRETPRTAIREAFALARERLREQRERESGRPELTEAPLRGRICSLSDVDGYGFIRSTEGEEIYFHRTGVPDHRFDQLDVGMEVRFVEEEVNGAIRATSVVPLSRRGRSRGLGDDRDGEAGEGEAWSRG